MQDFLYLCRQRFSVRSYAETPIDAADFDYIEECVMLAPSAHNYQPFRFFRLTAPADLEKVCAAYNRPWMVGVPCVYLVCRHTGEEWKREIDGKPHGDIDASIAIAHLCLAAAERGLGTCIVGNFDPAQIATLFGLPAELVPVALVPMGHPAAGTAVPAKRRRPKAEIFSEQI